MTESGKTLRERHNDRDDGFRIYHHEKPSFEPSSVDLHLNNEFTFPYEKGKRVKVWDEDTYPEYRRDTVENPILGPHSFVLAETEERVELPADSVGFLHGRSSVGRLGLFVHNAGLVDAGFSGSLTLELFNAAPHEIELKAGMRICQMTVHTHEEVPDVDYSNQEESKYQNQVGATPSRLYSDFQ